MNISEATVFRIFDALAALLLTAIYIGASYWICISLFPTGSRTIILTVIGATAISAFITMFNVLGNCPRLPHPGVERSHRRAPCIVA